MVSTSMPENPNALSPSTQSTGLPVSTAAAIAVPMPIPITPPGADVEPLARLMHVDDAAGEVERVGTLVDEDGVGPFLDDGAQDAERAVIIHRRVVVHQPRRHLRDVVVALGLDGIEPVGRRRRPVA